MVVCRMDIKIIIESEFPGLNINQLLAVPGLMEELFGSAGEARLVLDMNPYYLIGKEYW